MTYTDILVNRRPNQTIFSFAEIAAMAGKTNMVNLKSSVNYHVKKGDLLRLAKGLYALNKDYSQEELGNKLRTPSYVSLYTILSQQGMVFQPYTSIFMVANHSEAREINSQKFIFCQMKPKFLLNSLGINHDGEVSKASRERALLDTFYIYGIQHIDNLRSVDWDKMESINNQVFRNPKFTKYIAEMRYVE